VPLVHWSRSNPLISEFLNSQFLNFIIRGYRLIYLLMGDPKNPERPLKIWLDYRLYGFCQIFQKIQIKQQLNLESSFKKINIRGIKNAIRKRFFRCPGGFNHPGHTYPPYTVATLRIFNPFLILYAACRHQASKLFLVIVVKRALLALSCK